MSLVYNQLIQPIVLCILDGWGIGIEDDSNAIYKAYTPFWDFCLKTYPNSQISTSGYDVGLPEGLMGNSEVGHMNIGSGRIIKQDIVKINESISTNKLAENQSVLELIATLKHNKKKCHLLGLISNGGVHSHINHIIYLSEIISKNDIEVCLHCFLDGRDVKQKSAIQFVQQILEHFVTNKKVRISSISGRYFVMDRDNKWDRIEKAYKAIAEAKGVKSSDFIKSIKVNYHNNITDEFIAPIIDNNYHGIEQGDALVMANFRSDRARQILWSFTPEFNQFFRKTKPQFSYMLGMVQYSNDLDRFIKAIFLNDMIKNDLPHVLSINNINQLRIAETEKYAHVTFFFNSGKEDHYPGEDRILIQSPDVKTYDLLPEMSAYELTDKLISQIHQNKYHFILVNFANADMVGHTGNFHATVKAIETIDQCLELVVNAVNEINGTTIITADHGNAEKMSDNLGLFKHTAHTTNKVPFIIARQHNKNISLNNGRLCDIAPTILELMSIVKPEEMTGISLIQKSN